MHRELAHKDYELIIQRITNALAENYVFPETAEEMAEYMQNKFNQGGYDSITDIQTFCRILTDDLRHISNDSHFGVIHNPEQAKAMTRRETPEERHEEADKFYWTEICKENLGFEKLQRLHGNIGYIDIRTFVPGKEAGDIAVAAMNFLKHCNALIFDLRRNRGGAPSTLLLLASYLFNEAKHINTFYYRDTDEYEQFWTFPYIPGEKMPNIPAYILVSKQTCSAAEEFAYDLKNMKRAIIIGETTMGLAHMIKWTVVNDEIVMAVPFARPINPITNTDWEGKGVDPDIAASFQDALKVAHIHALEHLIDVHEDDEAKSYFWSELEDAKEYYEMV